MNRLKQLRRAVRWWKLGYLRFAAVELAEALSGRWIGLTGREAWA